MSAASVTDRNVQAPSLSPGRRYPPCPRTQNDMNVLTDDLHAHDLMLSRPEPGHALGQVADEWEAAEVWLRHTFAKAGLMKGQSMRAVASVLGHASVDTTMIYTDQDALDLVQALERTVPDAIAGAHAAH